MLSIYNQRKYLVMTVLFACIVACSGSYVDVVYCYLSKRSWTDLSDDPNLSNRKQPIKQIISRIVVINHNKSSESDIMVRRVENREVLSVIKSTFENAALITFGTTSYLLRRNKKLLLFNQQKYIQIYSNHY